MTVWLDFFFQALVQALAWVLAVALVLVPIVWAAIVAARFQTDDKPEDDR